MWLCVAGLLIYLCYFRMFRSALRSRPRSVSIPLRFAGSTGRFSLRPRGNGSRVEIVTGDAVVAEIVATDLGDEIVVDTAEVADGDVVYLGSAIGQAIDMAASAEGEYVTSLKSNAGLGVMVRQGRRPIRVGDGRHLARIHWPSASS
jgi:hypothetical protein